MSGLINKGEFYSRTTNPTHPGQEPPVTYISCKYLTSFYTKLLCKTVKKKKPCAIRHARYVTFTFIKSQMFLSFLSLLGVSCPCTPPPCPEVRLNRKYVIKPVTLAPHPPPTPTDEKGYPSSEMPGESPRPQMIFQKGFLGWLIFCR